MQKELKNSQQNNMLMVKDLQQNTAHHRGLFASLSRDIHWIKQKQHDRKRLKQANCLLHEKNTELKDKLLAAETQASPNPASRCCLPRSLTIRLLPNPKAASRRLATTSAASRSSCKPSRVSATRRGSRRRSGTTRSSRRSATTPSCSRSATVVRRPTRRRCCASAARPSARARPTGASWRRSTRSCTRASSATRRRSRRASRTSRTSAPTTGPSARRRSRRSGRGSRCTSGCAASSRSCRLGLGWGLG